MENKVEKIQELVRERAELQAKLSLLPYFGTPEIKENASGKYLYMRRRVAGRLTSVYVDKFSEDLYQALLRFSKEGRALKKSIRQVEKQLVLLGYTPSELSLRVEENLDFARINMKINIYNQAVLEGVATTFPQTETIIDNGKVSGITAGDIQKILNLKHAWEFILDKDVVLAKSDYYILSHIAKLVNDGFYQNGGKIRSVPVSIGGSKYVPPIPVEADVKENIEKILSEETDPIDKAINLCLYCMKTQIFNDGNKRSAVIFVNHYLISQGKGLLVIPEQMVKEFKKLLVDFYEDKNIDTIKEFMKKHCWKRF